MNNCIRTGKNIDSIQKYLIPIFNCRCDNCKRMSKRGRDMCVCNTTSETPCLSKKHHCKRNEQCHCGNCKCSCLNNRRLCKSKLHRCICIYYGAEICRQNRVATGYEIVNRTMFPNFHKCIGNVMSYNGSAYGIISCSVESCLMHKQLAKNYLIYTNLPEDLKKIICDYTVGKYYIDQLKSYTTQLSYAINEVENGLLY